MFTNFGNFFLAFFVLRQAGHIATVDLQEIRIDVVKQLERVKARTKSGQCKAAAQLFPLGDKLLRGAKHRHDFTFGHFEHDASVFQRGALQPGETLLVHGGSSGIGTTAIQLAKALGSHVAVTAGDDAKCSACRELGAEWAINYKAEDFEEVLNAEGVDVILDMVGGDYIVKNLRLLKDDGRLVFVNAMQGGKGEFNALEVMRRRLHITGSTLRPRSVDFKAALAADVEKHVWPLIAAGKFRPVIYQTFPLNEAAAAHELMESSAHIGKIVLEVGG